MTKKSLREKISEILDFILPRTKEARLLDSIDAGSFLSKARPSSNTGQDLVAIFDYRDPLVKELVWQLKFKGNKKLAKLMAELMHDNIVDLIGERCLFEDFQRPVVLPVPLSQKREKERGFNQCQLVCDILSSIDKNSNFEVNDDVVVKTRDTRNQTSLGTKALRETNLRGCFLVKDPAAIKGQNVIIIDDVYTTGSTINEIKKTLISAGAKKVAGLTFAH